MPLSDREIEQSLSFAEQLDGIITGHQEETQQVLAQNRHLCTIICDQQDEIRQLRVENEKLRAENQLLRSKPNITVTTDNYVENLTVQRQIVTTHRLSKTKKSKPSNQLSLWDQIALSS